MDEFSLDLRHSQATGLSQLKTDDGYDLSSYDLELTLEDGQGKRTQPWLKSGPSFRNCYSPVRTLTSQRVTIRFGCIAGAVAERDPDFQISDVYAIGVKVFDGLGGVKVTSARLVRR